MVEAAVLARALGRLGVGGWPLGQDGIWLSCLIGTGASVLRHTLPYAIDRLTRPAAVAGQFATASSGIITLV
jgi:hypothetical protein